MKDNGLSRVRPLWRRGLLLVRKGMLRTGAMRVYGHARTSPSNGHLNHAEAASDDSQTNRRTP